MSRISCISLPVADLEKSLAFYRDGLRLETSDFPAELTAEADHIPLLLPGNIYLVLILRAGFDDFTRMGGLDDAQPGRSSCILSYFAADRAEVDSLLQSCLAHGGKSTGQAEDRPWGYCALVQDPDANLWEILHNANLA